MREIQVLQAHMLTLTAPRPLPLPFPFPLCTPPPPLSGVLLCSLGWPAPCYVEHVGINLTEVPLLPEDWD